MTINEAMIWKKTLEARLRELQELRNENSAKETRRYGVGGDKEVTKTPVYDVRQLDKLVTAIHREVRKLDQAIKSTNAVTQVSGYVPDDAVLGEVA